MSSQLTLLLRFVFVSACVLVVVALSHSAAAAAEEEEKSLSNEDTGAASSNSGSDPFHHDLSPHLPHHARLLIPSRVQLGRISYNFPRPPPPDPTVAAHIRLSAEAKFRQQQDYPTSRRVWVAFERPFRASAVVHVLVGITEFDTEQEQIRMRAAAEGANATGFFLTAGSWMEPAMARITVSWLATDLPARQLQIIQHEQFMRTIEWGVEEKIFSPPLVLSTLIPTSNGDAAGINVDSSAAAAAAEDSDTTEAKREKLLSELLANKLRPSLLSVISKLDQRADAFWAKFDVQALSVTPHGFTSLLRPWGDAPTFWVSVMHLASALPLPLLQTGEFKTIHERLGAPVIQFSEPMMCDAPDVLVFTTLIDQGPVKRSSTARAQKVTKENFELFFDLRRGAQSIQAKFSWIAVC